MSAPRAFPCAVAIACAAAACSGGERQRLEETTRATYDPATGVLRELTYDANRNGRIDTWTEMQGSRPLRARVDRDEDGTIDRWEYYDEKGGLVKVGFSRRGDGTPDGWAYPAADGTVRQVELSSLRDERRIDRIERYLPFVPAEGTAGTLLSAEEDTDADGRPDKWETYTGGRIATVAFDEDRDGSADRRLAYDADGRLAAVETQPDGRGGYRRRVTPAAGNGSRP